ncbi:TetR/AcrR family transcriptional regulator [Dactylosporangium sp. NPDC049525]|uniref:TetR/AcrR family transcriptional regulator n=1 Tax=Dactylosporangium sp. NPDC049525 TaxID=3154730 RepID=UPI003421FA11
MSEQQLGGVVAPRRSGTYGGQTQQERAADRRERIVAAAVQLFAARDYDDITVADVCALAKVSKRYFYDDFTDREDLLLVVHRQQNDWLLAGVAAAAPKRPEDLEQLLRPMLVTLVGMLLEQPARARVIYINAPRMETRRRGLLRKDVELFGRLVRPFVRRSRDKARHERLLLALMAGLSEVVMDWVSRGMTDPPEPLVEHLTAYALAVLGALR